jgi:hypothetical protein
MVEYLGIDETQLPKLMILVSLDENLKKFFLKGELNK